MEDLSAMPFEMKNLTSFPMEQLCFDLKLEILEQMDAKDVVELIKVYQGFQGMLVRRPSIVFGQQVYWIQFHDKTVWIKKFSNSNGMKLSITFSHFFKKIRSCHLFWFGTNYQFNEIYTLLKNLKSVNRLRLLWKSKEALERFFSNFHASIKKEAKLNINCSAFNDQVIKDRIENFMLGPQLKDCEEISLDSHSEDSVRFYYNALLKAEIKNVFLRAYGWMDWIVQQIITNGIPSKNPEAVILLDSYAFTVDLSQYPGMRRIDGENRLRLLNQAKYLARNLRYYCWDGSDVLTEESSIFRRRCDSSKDCIYVYDEEGFFLAFDVPVESNA